MPDWEALQETIAGEVLTPESPGYEAARKPAIARFHDVRPQAVVRCAAPEDVIEATAVGIPVAARSGGHCFAGGSSTTGVVIDVGPLDDVSVSDGLATIGAGARLGRVYDALAEHRVTISAGCGPEVGIAGLTLGGGLGIMGRRHGLTSDSLAGAEVVLDGRLVACDEQREPELFWALRGAGGGRFGIVTSFTFRTVPAPEMTAFDLRWAWGEAAPLVEAWQEWSPDGPDELAASLLITAGPDPDEPPAVKVFGAMLGSEAETETVLGHLERHRRALPRLAPRGQAAPGRSGRSGGGAPVQPFRVLPRAAAGGGDRSTPGPLRGRPAAGRGARARLLALGRRLQPRRGRRDRVRPSRRALPAQACRRAAAGSGAERLA
jgi:FAD/FMN-containing dehydrogenase